MACAVTLHVFNSVVFHKYIYKFGDLTNRSFENDPITLNFKLVVFFLFCDSPASEFYMPTFRNTLFHLYMRCTACIEYEDGTVFRNVGIENSDAGESPNKEYMILPVRHTTLSDFLSLRRNSRI